MDQNADSFKKHPYVDANKKSLNASQKQIQWQNFIVQKYQNGLSSKIEHMCTLIKKIYFLVN